MIYAYKQFCKIKILWRGESEMEENLFYIYHNLGKINYAIYQMHNS